MSAAADRLEHQAPLVIDLDGTLIKTDLLLESALKLLKAQPWALLSMLWWLLRGKAVLKAEIAKRVDLDVSTLPYNDEVLCRIREAQRAGRNVLMATAANGKYARQVAAHLGLFTAVLASDASDNLRGSHKLRAIREHLNGAAFDYAGNDANDLEIWRQCRGALVVNASARIIRTASAQREIEVIAPQRRQSIRSLLRAVRIHQWLKNLLLFVPLLASQQIHSVAADLDAALAFLVFGLCASSVYLLNDLLDLEADRGHPIKRERALASGEMSVARALALVPLLLFASVSLAAIWLPPKFLVVLTLYFAVTLIYSLWAKRQLMLDVITLAGLYTLRVIAGAAAISVALSFWLLALSMFIFLSLALVKRYSEIVLLTRINRAKVQGRGYEHGDLPLLQSMGTASGYLAVVVIALYINSPEVKRLYSQPNALWAICPLLLLWVSWVWMKAHRGQMHHDPVVFAVKDATSVLIGALCAISVMLASR